MDATDPLAACPVCSWAVPPESAAAADAIGVVVRVHGDRRRDEVQVVGARLGVLHSCPADLLERDALGRYVRGAG